MAAMAFVILEPIQVLPRLRLAPGFALVDQNGGSFSSESARGSVTLYNFAPTSCDSRCQDMSATMLDVQARVRTEVDLGSAEFSMVTIALDPTDPSQLSEAASSVGADGQEWRWVGSDDEANLRRSVGAGFQRYFEATESGEISYDPSFVLVDGNGVVRGDYRYGTIADDGEKLSRHVAILADEIRNANGAVAVAYEAAHLFLCYP
jgi:protein SCO1/2